MSFDGRSETPPSDWAANNGGFSNLFSRPAYQESAAAGFLEQLGDKHSGYFDRAGRGGACHTRSSLPVSFSSLSISSRRRLARMGERCGLCHGSSWNVGRVVRRYCRYAQ